MGVLTYAIITLFLLLPLGEIFRISFGSGIAITLLDITTAITFLVFLFYSFKTKNKLFALKENYNKAFLIFLFLCTVSLFVNLLHFTVMQISIGALYLVRWIIYATLFFAAYSLDKKQQNKILKTIVTSGVIFSIIGFLQFFFYNNLRNLFYLGWDDHLYRLFSSFLDPNFTGCFLSLNITLLSYYAINNYRNKKLLFLFTTMLSAEIIALILTYSRTAYIMLLVSIITLLILTGKKKFIVALTAFVIVLVLVLSPRFYIENTNLFRTVSSSERIKSENIALQIFQKNPILGVGFNTYKYAQIAYNFRSNVPSTMISHADAGTDNSYLFVLATTGVGGFLAYIYLQYSLIKKIINKYKTDKENKLFYVSILAAFVGLLVSALFLNTLFYPYILVWMWVIFGITVSM